MTRTSSNLAEVTAPRPENGLVFEVRGATASSLNVPSLGQEVFGAEFEGLEWVRGGGQTATVDIRRFDYEPQDANGVVPGWLIPGLIPFGPLAWWMWSDDSSTPTPSLTLEVEVRCQAASLTARTSVIRGVSSEEDLVRVAFSEVARQTRRWLESAR